MQITIRIDLGTDTHQVSTNLWVITQWERKFRRKASDLAQGIGVEDLAYLAYEACKVHGITVPAAFDDFIKKLHNIEVVDQEPENPTEAAPTGDN
jgi:hypothetical protein